MHAPQNVRRSPNSFTSELLQINTGCPHGKCHFCNLYERETYSVVPMRIFTELPRDFRKIG